MKSTFLVLFFTLFSSFLFSCSPEEVTPTTFTAKDTTLNTSDNSLQELKDLCLKSKSIWEEMKQEKQTNSYFYKDVFTSGEGNFTITKEVTFKDNAVIKLVIEEKIGNEIVTSEEINLDSQEATSALQGIRNIDEMYEYSLNELFDISEIENIIYFGTDENGIINLYGFFPKNCADDCFEGQSIEEFSWK